jgi:hypothetical protein
MKLSLFICGVALLMSLSLEANGQRRETHRPTQIDDVIRMSKAGVPDDIIISKIDKKLDLTVDQLIELKNAGVSDRIIRWMTDPGKGSVRESAPELSANGEIKDIGFYLLHGSKEMPLTSSVFTSQKTGTARLVFTSGLAKIKQKVSVPGSAANVRSTERNPTFLFYTPEGVDATEYLLIRLDKKSDKREITVGKFNILGTSIGIDPDHIVKVSNTKLASRKWMIATEVALKPGEYAFYPAAGVQSGGSGVNAAGKLYEFGID